MMISTRINIVSARENDHCYCNYIHDWNYKKIVLWTYTKRQYTSVM